ncbi:DUF1499 domain-containing protein [Paenibacillus contaminans]|uniref:DUF1499 domain-containing protein n=1 Tax=Paenibacillus contaminans TaxID=450362 RepID=A0A329LP55_9BACL|nr:DUF1499 domain-containing protein [Paenibacillus contaminans]RAV09489.1 hypothetical protein DQG23_39310 [Paenibacillus contaminans]
MLKRILIGLFRSFETTGDRAKDPALKTKFYKLSKDRTWEEVVTVLKKMNGYKILHEVPNVGEIVVEKKTVTGRKQDITLTIIPITPAKTAVDIYSASRGSLGDLGANYRTILEIYRTLERKLADHRST